MYLRMILIYGYIIADVFVFVNRNDSYLGQKYFVQEYYSHNHSGCKDANRYYFCIDKNGVIYQNNKTGER